MPLLLEYRLFVASYLTAKVSEFKKQNKPLIKKDKCALKEYNIGLPEITLKLKWDAHE